MCRFWLILALMVIAGCGGNGPLAQAPTALPTQTRVIVTRPPRTLEAAPTDTPRRAIAATATPRPTLPPINPPIITDTPNPTAAAALPTAPTGSFTIDGVTAKFQQRRITFILRFTPVTTVAQAAALVYRYPLTGEEVRWGVPTLPPQKLGVQSPALEHSFSVDKLPPLEYNIEYYWEFALEDGSTVKTEDYTFTLTESITAERRDDLPIIDAKTEYVSEFPRRSIFRVTLTPPEPIQFARFFFTQNSGITLNDYRVNVPTKKQGEEISLEFVWSNELGVQIPWQKFEHWWVFTLRSGRIVRTANAYDEYADNRYHKWDRTVTKRGVLFTYSLPRKDVNVLAAALDRGIEKLERAFGYKMRYVPHIVVYNSQRDFEDWAPPTLSENFIGLASGRWGGAVVAFYDSIKFTGYSIIIHELTHLFQYQSIRDDDVPQWFIEGTARLMEEETNLVEQEQVVRRIVARYGPPDLRFRVPARPPDGSGIPYPYYIGPTVIDWLQKNHGADVLVRIHRALARDIPFWDAIKMATGLSPEQLNAGWTAWITK